MWGCFFFGGGVIYFLWPDDVLCDKDNIVRGSDLMTFYVAKISFYVANMTLYNMANIFLCGRDGVFCG